MLAEYYNNEPFVRVLPFDAESNLDNGFFDVQRATTRTVSRFSCSATKSVS